MSTINNLAKERSYHSEILQGKMIIAVFQPNNLKSLSFNAQIMKYLKILNKYNYIKKPRVFKSLKKKQKN